VLFRWTGAAIAAGVMALPLMVRGRCGCRWSGRPRLENAARTLGAGPWRAFATITLPLALPGVLAGLVLGFARSIGEFGATITFVSNMPGETRTLPLAIYSALQCPMARRWWHGWRAVRGALAGGAGRPNCWRGVSGRGGGHVL
jgi:molybdate transport system permease protein